MKKLSLALLLTAACPVNAATITPPSIFEEKPTPICVEGALTLVKYIAAEPKKVFGEKAGESMSRLTNEERARIFALTKLTLDKDGPRESVCSISISANPKLDEVNKSKVEKLYPPTRIQFKVQKTDGEPLVSLMSFTRVPRE